jgi:protein CpxP
MNTTSRRRWILAGLLAAVGATVGLAGAGLAQEGHSLHGLHGTARHGRATDPAAMDRHFDKMLAQMLPDGTPAQKARLKTIAGGVHADLGAVHAQLQEAHLRTHDLLLRPTIDRAALETLRVEQVRQIDSLSKHLFGALADAAEVLTPEQRVRLAASHRGR